MSFLPENVIKWRQNGINVAQNGKKSKQNTNPREEENKIRKNQRNKNRIRKFMKTLLQVLYPLEHCNDFCKMGERKKEKIVCNLIWCLNLSCTNGINHTKLFNIHTISMYYIPFELNITLTYSHTSSVVHSLSLSLPCWKIN